MIISCDNHIINIKQKKYTSMFGVASEKCRVIGGLTKTSAENSSTESAKPSTRCLLQSIKRTVETTNIVFTYSNVSSSRQLAKDFVEDGAGDTDLVHDLKKGSVQTDSYEGEAKRVTKISKLLRIDFRKMELGMLNCIMCWRSKKVMDRAQGCTVAGGYQS